MRTPAISIILALFLACSMHCNARGQVGRDTKLWAWTAPAKHHQAIVKISIGDASATGILIDVLRDRPLGKGYEGLCLTAYHVVEKKKAAGGDIVKRKNAVPRKYVIDGNPIIETNNIVDSDVYRHDDVFENDSFFEPHPIIERDRIFEGDEIIQGDEIFEGARDHSTNTTEKKPTIKVKYRNGRGGRKSRVLRFNKELDVAILSVWVPEGVLPAKLASTDAQSSDALEFAGLGGNSNLECCLRHFSATASHPTNEDELFADVALLPGDSGGPVFNDRQEIVGIISGGWFWWDGGVTTSGGSSIHTTWPARACNLSAIQKLLEEVRLVNVARR